MMLSLGSARDGIECAVSIQQAMEARNHDHLESPLLVRIGINAGEPVEEDGDLYGASVVIAKRLESAAPENGILVSEVVKQAVAGNVCVNDGSDAVLFKPLCNFHSRQI